MILCWIFTAKLLELALLLVDCPERIQAKLQLPKEDITFQVGAALTISTTLTSTSNMSTCSMISLNEIDSMFDKKRPPTPTTSHSHSVPAEASSRPIASVKGKAPFSKKRKIPKPDMPSPYDTLSLKKCTLSR